MIEIFDNLSDAIKAGVLWGSETIDLKREEIEMILEGKVMAIEVEGEYMVFLRMKTNTRQNN